MTDIELPIADLDALLAQFPEHQQMHIVAWKLAQLVSPNCTPRSVLIQLGEKCPGQEVDDGCGGTGPVVHAERVPARLETHAVCPGSGRRRAVPRTPPQAAVDPSGAAHRGAEWETA